MNHNTKTVKCRADHICDACGEVIPAGQQAKYGAFRGPEYDKDDRQTGIFYYRYWLHPWVCVDADGDPITRAQAEAKEDALNDLLSDGLGMALLTDKRPYNGRDTL